MSTRFFLRDISIFPALALHAHMHWPLHSLEQTWASQLPQSMLTRTSTAHGDPSLAAPMLTTRFSYTRGYGGACTSYIALYTVRATQAHSHPWDRSRSPILYIYGRLDYIAYRNCLRASFYALFQFFPHGRCTYALYCTTVNARADFGVTGVTASTIEDFHSTRRPGANAHCQV